jgi:hypothetical protein
VSRRSLSTILFSLACACQAGEPAVFSPDAGAPDAATQPPAYSACATPTQIAALPRSVDEVIALLNDLPKPVTLPCFLESLPRPLAIQATRSITSAQPAVGARSPRLFLFFDPLIVSVVPAGLGEHLFELGERRGEAHSLKAEFEFPITREVQIADAFDRLRYNELNSTCDFCHAEAEPAADVDHPYALISRGLSPLPRERVPLADLVRETQACDADQEPDRCAMLRALFEGSPAVDGEFPGTYKTFF